VVTNVCNTTIELIDNKVVGFTLRGNGCN